MLVESGGVLLALSKAQHLGVGSITPGSYISCQNRYFWKCNDIKKDIETPIFLVPRCISLETHANLQRNDLQIP